ncbi:MAG: flavin reductase family protein [Thiohalocapsa sp.]
MTGSSPTTGLQTLDPSSAEAINAVHHLYDPPLWLVTAAESSTPGSPRGGCIATFVARASIVKRMPRMLAGIARQHHSWRMIESSGRFALQLLPESGLDLVWQFALQSGNDVNKFADLPDKRTPGGSPLIDGTLSWFDCRVETSTPTGDRTVYVAAVTDGGIIKPGGGPPLTAGRLMALAPPDKREQLDRLYTRDGAIDGRAIQAWRTQKPDRV